MRCAALKISLFFLFLFSYFSFLISPVSAQSSQQIPSGFNSDVPDNLHTYTQGLFVEVSSALICQLIGIDIINKNQACLGIDQETGKIGFVKNGGGLVGVMGQMIAVLYTPPLHTIDYMRYMASNFGIAKPAYAQATGYGFQGLSPLIHIWTVMRNIVYLLFVIVFVVVGFAIMLRIKIDPRTVMTIENQIPKLIIGLVMITFSFAISGLLVDFMWVGTYVSINVLSLSQPGAIDPVLVNKEIHTPPIGFVNQVFDKPLGISPIDGKEVPGFGGIFGLAKEAAQSTQQIIQSMFAPNKAENINDLLGPVLASRDRCDWWDIGCGIAATIGETIGVAMSQIIGWLLSWALGVVALLAVIIALIFALFRVWFQLLYAYLWILLDTVLAPFWIGAALLPGGMLGFGAWLRDMIANLLAFPATLILFLIGKLFMDAFATQAKSGGGQLFIPPLIGNPSLQHTLPALIGLATVLLTPVVVTMIKESIKAPQFKYSAAIGQSLASGPGVVGGGLHAFTNPYGALPAFQRAFSARSLGGGTILKAFTNPHFNVDEAIKAARGPGVGGAGAVAHQQTQAGHTP